MARTDHRRQRHPATIPVYFDQLETITQRFHEQRSLGLIFIDVFSRAGMSRPYDQQVRDELVRYLERLILDMRGALIRKDDLITVNHAGHEHFLIFLGKKREHRPFFPSDLESLRDRIARHLDEQLMKFRASVPMACPRVKVGHAIALHSPIVKEEQAVIQLIEDGKKMADYYEFRQRMRVKEKLQELIFKEQIRTLYQPIVELGTNIVFGYEALSRGPAGTEFESPAALFEMASESGLLAELDRVCSGRAVHNATGLPPEARLFINVLPATVYEPGFNAAQLKEFFSRHGIDPHRVVVEISEREAITNFDRFRAAMARFNGLGFAVAIDDVGTGYANLDLVVELQPAFMKIDLMMVRQIDRHPLKQELIRSIVGLARRIGSKVIAEGIETAEERDTITALGVDYGQGYLFGRPGLPFPSIAR